MRPLADLSDEALARLAEIAQEHTHLAAIFGRPGTTRQEKQAIKARIEALKRERDNMLRPYPLRR